MPMKTANRKKGKKEFSEGEWFLNADVLAIAQTIQDERRFEDLPILADALEDAGCDDEAILNHCRGLEVVWRGLCSHLRSKKVESHINSIECPICHVRAERHQLLQTNPHSQDCCFVIDLILRKQ